VGTPSQPLARQGLAG
jgi:hypothetical protein